MTNKRVAVGVLAAAGILRLPAAPSAATTTAALIGAQSLSSEAR